LRHDIKVLIENPDLTDIVVHYDNPKPAILQGKKIHIEDFIFSSGVVPVF